MIPFYAFLIFVIINVIFLVWSMGLLIFCWCYAKLPESSSFPDMDLVARSVSEETDTTKIGSIFGNTNMDTGEMLNVCQDRQIYCDEIGGQVRLRLNERESYELIEN